MDNVLNAFESYAQAVAEELIKKIDDEQFFLESTEKALLYAEVFNTLHRYDKKHVRLFYVHDREDVKRLLSEPYDFAPFYLCRRVMNATTEMSANFLYYNGEEGLYVVPTQTLISMLQGCMEDLVKDVLRYNANEVYQRFYTSEIFGLIYDND